MAQSADAIEGGGEDWSDAYRYCPMDRVASLCCVVVWWHSGRGEPTFQLYMGLLFGLPVAVTSSFTRYNRVEEALGRRLLAILISLYFHDSHFTNWASSKGSAQEAFSGLNNCIVSPFPEAKRQRMAATGTFLGLDFDLPNSLSVSA